VTDRTRHKVVMGITVHLRKGFWYSNLQTRAHRKQLRREQGGK
jgi:hypothetical protein